MCLPCHGRRPPRGVLLFPGGPRGRALRAAQRDRDRSLDQKVAKEELGRLVPLGSTPRGASTCGLSTSWSTRGLTEGRTHLWTGFPLRCFQRLSEPDSATGRCRWSTTRAPEVRPPRSSRTRGSSACYPRSTFYPLSDGHTTLSRRITRTWFPTCSTCPSRSQACLRSCTLKDGCRPSRADLTCASVTF